MTKKLAGILADKLDRGDEALAALTELADQGDPGIREAYVDLGDRLGWKGIVAQQARRVVVRGEARPGAHDAAARRVRALRRGRARSGRRARRHRDRALQGGRPRARRTPRGARRSRRPTTTRSRSRTISWRGTLAGAERANELVRQAEARVRGGDAAHRGDPARRGRAHERRPRQRPSRCSSASRRSPGSRSRSSTSTSGRSRAARRPRIASARLARAAQVAAAKGPIDRARGFFELALAGAPSDETLAPLEEYRARRRPRDGRREAPANALRGDGAGRPGRARRRPHARRAPAARRLDGAPRSERRRPGVRLARRRAHRPRRRPHPRRARGARRRGRRPAPRARRPSPARSPRSSTGRSSASSSRAARSSGASSWTTRRAPRPT